MLWIEEKKKKTQSWHPKDNFKKNHAETPK